MVCQLLAGMSLLFSHAFAYETDQLTDRHVALRDAEQVADDEANRLLYQAVERTNEQTGCHSSPRTTHRLLAQNIYDITEFPTFVKGRGELAGFGYGAYGAFLETDPGVDRRSFLDADDLYDHVGPAESAVLGTVGVCSTVQIAGVLVGTDKPDHFWAQGYEYFGASKRGRLPERAKEWGVSSELGAYGLLTSGVFSFADLAANWQGYLFYVGLLGERSAIQVGEDGCVAQVRPFRWRDWLSDAMDEVVNPPAYRKGVAEGVLEHLEAHADEVCEDYRRWRVPVGFRRAQAWGAQEDQLTSRAPEREDEWQLDELCGVR